MLTLNPRTTALVVIDLQNGIVALPLMPYDAGHVIARCVDLGYALAEAGGIIVLVNVDYSEGYADRPNQPADAPLSLPPEGLPENWAMLVPEIALLPAPLYITKRQHSAFYGTELDLQLRRRGITTVIICGLATNFGVEGSARDAYNLNYAVVIAADACSSTSQGFHEFAVTNILPRIALVRDTSEVIVAVGAVVY